MNYYPIETSFTCEGGKWKGRHFASLHIRKEDTPLPGDYLINEGGEPYIIEEVDWHKFLEDLPFRIIVVLLNRPISNDEFVKIKKVSKNVEESYQG